MPILNPVKNTDTYCIIALCNTSPYLNPQQVTHNMPTAFYTYTDHVYYLNCTTFLSIEVLLNNIKYRNKIPRITSSLIVNIVLLIRIELLSMKHNDAQGLMCVIHCKKARIVGQCIYIGPKGTMYMTSLPITKHLIPTSTLL